MFGDCSVSGDSTSLDPGPGPGRSARPVDCHLLSQPPRRAPRCRLAHVHCCPVSSWFSPHAPATSRARRGTSFRRTPHWRTTSIAPALHPPPTATSVRCPYSVRRAFRHKGCQARAHATHPRRPISGGASCPCSTVPTSASIEPTNPLSRRSIARPAFERATHPPPRCLGEFSRDREQELAVALARLDGH